MRRLTRVNPPDIVTVLSMGVAGALITFARCSQTIRHPELYAEDGVVWFANAYQDGPFRPLLSPHTGYLQTFPRLIADIGLVVPLRRLPLLFVLVAVLVQVLPAGLVASRRFAAIIPSFPIRLVLAFAYLLIPNSQEVNANLTNAQWHLALLAFLVLVADDAGRWWRAFDVIVVVLSGLTGPFTIVLAPLGIIIFVIRRRKWTGVLSILLSTTAIIQAVCLLVSPRGEYASLGMTPGRFAEIVGGQVVGGTLVGPPATLPGHLISSDPLVSSLLMAAGAVICVFALWRGSMELRLFNVFAVALLASSLAAPVGSVAQPQWLALVGDIGVRYWFFPTLALVTDLIWMAGQIRIWRGIPALLGSLTLAFVVLFGVRDSFQYTPLLPRPNWPVEVNSFNQLKEGSQYTFYITPSGWEFTLVKN